MTAVTADAPLTVARVNRGHAVGDALTMAWRNLLNIRRNPQLLVFATIQPVIFVLMFRYVFGGAIQGSLPPGQTYVDFLMPGIFVQTVVFGSLTTGVGLADDLSKGLIDRFRSLPMARSAVLVGRTLADLVRNFFVVILMCVVGFLVGWTIGTNVWGLLGAVGDRPRVLVLAVVGVRHRRAHRCRTPRPRRRRRSRSWPRWCSRRRRSCRCRPCRRGCRAGPRTSRCRSSSTPPAPSPSAVRRRST